MGCGTEVSVSSAGFCNDCWDDIDTLDTPDGTKLNHGYIFRSSQINKPRPYDDADYYTAHYVAGSKWSIVYKGKIERTITTVDLNGLADKLHELNNTIKSRMVHN